jgi:hypothetical protein
MEGEATKGSAWDRRDKHCGTLVIEKTRTALEKGAPVIEETRTAKRAWLLAS